MPGEAGIMAGGEAGGGPFELQIGRKQAVAVSASSLTTGCPRAGTSLSGTGKYRQKVITGGAGHHLHWEAYDAFAAFVIEADAQSLASIM